MQSVWTYGRVLSRAIFSTYGYGSGSSSPTGSSTTAELSHCTTHIPSDGVVSCGGGASSYSSSAAAVGAAGAGGSGAGPSAVTASGGGSSVVAAAVQKYNLLVTQSGVANTQRVSPHALQLYTGVYGDDACFIAESTDAHVIGVADGVGGWRQYGIDPAVFSRNLMQTCERLVHAGQFTVREPKSLIATSYTELRASKTPILGSSTACILMLDKVGHTLYTANLGDSGFILVRDGEVLHRSSEQQHYFNTPYQLSMPPPTLQHAGGGGAAAGGGGHHHVLSDSPDSADTCEFLVEYGDLIVVGTDGLFDNLSDHMILKQLNKLKDTSSESIQHTAHSLAKQAAHLSNDPDYMSPFAHNATQHGINIKGGKPDDITVLVSVLAPYD